MQMPNNSYSSPQAVAIANNTAAEKTKSNKRLAAAKNNYETLKDNPTFRRFIDWGGAPTAEETGMSEAEYRAFIDALEYGKKVESSATDDMQKSLENRGFKTDRYINRGGEDTVEIVE